MELYRLKACSRCRGDLAWDEGDWICLQCGAYYYTRLYSERLTARPGREQEARPRWALGDVTPRQPRKSWGQAWRPGDSVLVVGAGIAFSGIRGGWNTASAVAQAVCPP